MKKVLWEREEMGAHTERTENDQDLCSHKIAKEL